MLKSLKKRSYRFVVVLLLLATLLTFDVGRVTKVEAVATTTAIVGEVLLGLGVTYIAYQTLTGANVYVPGYEETDMYDYIRGLGRDFSLSDSGSRLFSDLYNKLIADDTYSVVDFTQDRLRDIYNDHKDIQDLQFDSSFEYTIDTSLTPTNGFDYSDYSIVSPNPIVHVNGNTVPLSSLTIENVPAGPLYYIHSGDAYLTPVPTTITQQVRNYKDGSRFYPQYYDTNSDTWNNFTRIYYSYGRDVGGYWVMPYPITNGFDYYAAPGQGQVSGQIFETYPLFPNEVIYDSSTDEYLPLVPVDSTGNQLTPQYPQNDDGNNKFPIVPYVQLPSTQKWGFNWRDALTDLVNGGSRLITYSWLADLINDFKNSLSGTGDDIDYNYFNEGDTYYITYYSTTVNDINNPVYNINVSEQEDVIPVDLNTIQQYTNNQYLTLIKERAETFGETFGELVAFWHNCDPEIIYAFLGASIIILLGAFIGKWGHS